MSSELSINDDKIISIHDDLISTVKSNQELCSLLLQSPHYKKMGPEGIYAIVEKARSIGVNPLDALNGAMFFVQGKVEMTAQLMNQLIRAQKHSITQDASSDASCCVLIGKRADNGDTWTSSFSIDDAKLAGIYRNQWLKYPQDMLFARALSRLGRQLFPDILRGVYVQGEISDALDAENMVKTAKAPPKRMESSITQEQYEDLLEALGDNEELKEKIISFMKSKYSVAHLSLMPNSLYDFAMRRALEMKAHLVSIST